VKVGTLLMRDMRVEQELGVITKIIYAPPLPERNYDEMDIFEIRWARSANLYKYSYPRHLAEGYINDRIWRVMA